MDRIFKIKKESPIHKVVIGSLEDYFDQENIQHSKYARIKIRKYICVNELLMKKLVELFNLFKLNESEEEIILKILRQKKISTSMKIKTLKIVIRILRKKVFE